MHFVKVMTGLCLAAACGFMFGTAPDAPKPDEVVQKLSAPSITSVTRGETSKPAQAPAFAEVRGNTPPALPNATLLHHAEPNLPISVIITLDLRDHAGADRLIAAQQDPASPFYHQWISPQDFQSRFGPLPADIQAARDFLIAEGFANIAQPTSTMIAGEGTVDKAERAFNVLINHYIHQGKPVRSNDRNPSLPASLASKVIHVGGLETFTVVHPHHHGVTELGPHYDLSGTKYMLPRDTQMAYGEKTAYFDTGKKGISGAELAVASSYDIQLSDVNDQLTRQGGAAAGYNLMTSATSGAHTISSTCVPNTGSGSGCSFTNGGGPNGHQSLETNWDVSLACSIANDCHIGVYLTSDQLTTSFSTLYQYIADRSSTIKVVSHSWGLCLSVMSASVVTADDNAFAQAAAGGQAWFVATGDSGSNDCAGNGGANPDVDYPAASPYVTGCGGTSQDPTGAFGGDGWMTGYPSGGEQACSDGGGGEASNANAEPRPSWQTGTGVPAGNNKRLVPDISMHYGSCATPSTGRPYVAMIGGSLFTLNGTSGDSPQWAGYWAVGNQVVTAAGGSLGQAAPLLFRVLRSENGTSYANSFHDITSGSNGAYSATTGYDRSTGIGTPKFNNLYSDLALLFSTTSSGCLTDTTQADFQAGVATNLDTTTTPGSVTLSRQ